MKLYVTGVSGTGKTSIARQLNTEGIKAIDIDDLSHWENKETGDTDIDFGHGMSEEWYQEHAWVCDIEALKKELESSENVVAVGASTNQDQYINFFDKKIVLSCSPETIVARIQERKDNNFGKDPTEQKIVLDWQEKFVPEMISREGAIHVSAERPLNEVVEEIKKHFK